ncbi:MAG: rod shape-determining protein MreC [Flammeovirgaceae bacterium]|nr:rod shape-determining protein MreC [Flammeovirgaceae bacterium]
MQQLIAFFFRNRFFGFFLFLELISFSLFFSSSNLYNSYLFNTSNKFVGTVLETNHNIDQYFQLDEINQKLLIENALLREELLKKNLGVIGYDTLMADMRVIPALVINNEFRKLENYLTIDKGSLSQLEVGMAVISREGVVGIIKSVSDHFSTVTSILNRKLMISSRLNKTNTLCTVQWNLEGPLEANLKYIPRHINVNIGDTVSTSGYNAVFPSNVMLGTVVSYQLPDESPFYMAKIKLSSDLSSIDAVYVIKNPFKDEMDSLQTVL